MTSWRTQLPSRKRFLTIFQTSLSLIWSRNRGSWTQKTILNKCLPRKESNQKNILQNSQSSHKAGTWTFRWKCLKIQRTTFNLCNNLLSWINLSLVTSRLILVLYYKWTKITFRISQSKEGPKFKFLRGMIFLCLNMRNKEGQCFKPISLNEGWFSTKQLKTLLLGIQERSCSASIQESISSWKKKLQNGKRI